MVKRKSPRKIIENENRPSLEQAYVKGPRSDLSQTGIWRGKYDVLNPFNIPLLSRLYLKAKGHKRIMEIHTHPSHSKDQETDPSFRDFNLFLENSSSRTMVVAQTDSQSGKLEGYFVVRKTKKTPKLSTLGRPFRKQFSGEQDNPLDVFADKYHLQYRFIPTKGYRIDREKNRFVEKAEGEKSLERKMVYVIGISLLASIILFSPNLTGNVVGNLTKNSSNRIGGILLILGLVGIYLWKKKQTTR